MRRTIVAIAIAAAMATSPLAAAAGERGSLEDYRQAIEEATHTLMRAIEMMLKAIPQYEAPEILDNGDIIIRRKRPKVEPPEPAPAPKTPGQTKT